MVAIRVSSALDCLRHSSLQLVVCVTGEVFHVSQETHQLYALEL